jgi:hypothetical protein
MRSLTMYGVKTFRLTLRQIDEAHGTDLECLVLDALDDSTGHTRAHGVRLDDGKRQFHIRSL